MRSCNATVITASSGKFNADLIPSVTFVAWPRVIGIMCPLLIIASCCHTLVVQSVKHHGICNNCGSTVIQRFLDAPDMFTPVVVRKLLHSRLSYRLTIGRVAQDARLRSLGNIVKQKTKYPYASISSVELRLVYLLSGTPFFDLS